MRNRSSKKRAKNRKYVKFHRDWKKLLHEREIGIQHQLRNERNDNVNDSELSFNEITNDGMHIERPDTLAEQLKSWTMQNRISMRCLDGLLGVLRSNGHTELPKSYRTLLNTPRNVELVTFGESKYWYRGLTDCLKTVFCNTNRHLEVTLKFNIDGLPIFNSSRIQFWPILASIVGESTKFLKFLSF